MSVEAFGIETEFLSSLLNEGELAWWVRLWRAVTPSRDPGSRLIKAWAMDGGAARRRRLPDVGRARTRPATPHAQLSGGEQLRLWFAAGSER